MMMMKEEDMKKEKQEETYDSQSTLLLYGREKEMAIMYQFLSSSARTLCLRSFPGLGKTLCINTLITAIRKKQVNKTEEPITHSMSNANLHWTFYQYWGSQGESILKCIQTVERQQRQEEERKTLHLLVIDEIDNLLPSVMKQLKRTLPQLDHVKLIGITNSMGLMIPPHHLQKMNWISFDQTIIFKPYTIETLAIILKSKYFVGEYNSDIYDYISRKLYFTGSDIRVGGTIIAELVSKRLHTLTDDGNNHKTSFTLADMIATCNDKENYMCSVIKSLSDYAKIILFILMLCSSLRLSSIRNMTFIQHIYPFFVNKVFSFLPSFDAQRLHGMLSELETCQIIQIQGGGRGKRLGKKRIKLASFDSKPRHSPLADSNMMLSILLPLADIFDSLNESKPKPTSLLGKMFSQLDSSWQVEFLHLFG